MLDLPCCALAFFGCKQRGAPFELRCTGIALGWLLLLRDTGSRCVGFSSCSALTQQLWRMDSVAPWHVGSSWARNRTRVSCINRQIVVHYTTREVSHVSAKIRLVCFFLQKSSPINNAPGISAKVSCYFIDS